MTNNINMIKNRNYIVLISIALVVLFSSIVFFLTNDLNRTARNMANTIAESTATINAAVVESEFSELVSQCELYQNNIISVIEQGNKLDQGIKSIFKTLTTKSGYNFNKWCYFQTNEDTLFYINGIKSDFPSYHIDKIEQNTIFNTSVSNPYIKEINDTSVYVISIVKRFTTIYGKKNYMCFDITLNQLHSILADINELRTGYVTIISGNGICIAHPEKSYIGKKNSELPINERYINTTKKPLREKSFSDFLKLKVYKLYTTISPDKNKLKWNLMVSVPLLGVDYWYDKLVTSSLIIGVVFMLVLILILLFYVRKWLFEINKRRFAEKTIKNLKAMQEKLIVREKMTSLGELTAGIAHEINNPINFISANIMPLKRDVADVYDNFKTNKCSDKTTDFLFEEINDLIECIEDGAKRTADIVKGLKEFSRSDNEVFSPCSINNIIDSSLILLKHKYKDKIVLERSTSNDFIVECVAGKLNQVITNLLNNAIKAIENKSIKDGRIVISTSNQDNLLIISVKDNGVGMSKKVEKRIFEPFYTRQKQGEGTGLGLSVSYGIIKQHGGRIKVNSQEGIGTEFVVKIPLNRKQDGNR